MAFEHRQRADYGELSRLDEPVVTRVIDEARAFIQNVKAYMKTKDFMPLDANGNRQGQ